MRYLLIVVILLSVGCRASQSMPRNDLILCTAAYRTAVTKPIEKEDQYQLDESNDEVTVQYDDIEWRVQYQTGELDQERSVVIFVTINEQPATTQLYQLPLDSGPLNQFVGGHGFTGLNYFVHPTTGAELQYWCEAGPG